MKKGLKKTLIVLCSIVLFSSNSIGLVAHAEGKEDELTIREYQEPSGENIAAGIHNREGNSGARAAMLDGCVIYVTVSESGVVASISTGATEVAKEIGVRDIKVQKKINGIWVTLVEHSGLHDYNDTDFAVDVTTGYAEKGAYYRVSCTHYAILSDGLHEIFNETKGICY